MQEGSSLIMPDDEKINMGPTTFFTCIIVSILIGAAIAYVISLLVARFTEPKKTLVMRDERGRLEGIIETR